MIKWSRIISLFFFFFFFNQKRFLSKTLKLESCTFLKSLSILKKQFDMEFSYKLVYTRYMLVLFNNPLFIQSPSHVGSCFQKRKNYLKIKQNHKILKRVNSDFKTGYIYTLHLHSVDFYSRHHLNCPSDLTT